MSCKQSHLPRRSQRADASHSEPSQSRRSRGQSTHVLNMIRWSLQINPCLRPRRTYLQAGWGAGPQPWSGLAASKGLRPLPRTEGKPWPVDVAGVGVGALPLPRAAAVSTGLRVLPVRLVLRPVGPVQVQQRDAVPAVGLERVSK